MRDLEKFELPKNVVVVAPHPDDETLACGGLLHDVVDAGYAARVVVVTDGQSYRDACVFWQEGRIPRAADPCTVDSLDQFGLYRRIETLEALERLGVAKSCVTFLGGVDSTLRDAWAHWHAHPTRPAFGADGGQISRAAVRGANIMEGLRTVFTQAYDAAEPLTVFTTHPLDGHADHQATYQFVRGALEELGIEAKIVTSVIHCHAHDNFSYPNPPQTMPVNLGGVVDLAYLAEDTTRIAACRAERFAPDTRLEPPTDAEYGEPLSYELSALARDAKHQAIMAYETQIGLVSRKGKVEPSHLGWVDAIGFLNAFEHPNEIFYAMNGAPQHRHNAQRPARD